jgi:hypothetical protein
MRVINWTLGLEVRVQDQKVANLRLNLHGTILEGKSIDSNQKKKLGLN